MIKWFLVYCLVGAVLTAALALWKASKGDEEASDLFLFPAWEPLIMCLLIPFWPILVIVALTNKTSGKYELSNQGVIDSKELPNDLIGRIAVVEQELRPSGTVVLDGKSYSALSTGSMVSSGASVQVVKQEGFSLSVETLPNQPEDFEQFVPPKFDRAGG